MQTPAKPIPILTEKNKRNFFRKISATTTESGCMDWTACKTKDGYGQFGIGGSLFLAHRIAYFLHHGVDPVGFLVCHHCDNPACCNGDHFFLGMDADNSRDKEAKGRSRPPRGEDHGRSKLKESDITAIRSDGRTINVIASDYGVFHTTVSKIKRREIWQHVS